MGESSPKPWRDGRSVGAHAGRGEASCDTRLRDPKPPKLRRNGTRGAEPRRRMDTHAVGRVSCVCRPAAGGIHATPAFPSRRDQTPLLFLSTPTYVATVRSFAPSPLPASKRHVGRQTNRPRLQRPHGQLSLVDLFAVFLGGWMGRRTCDARIVRRRRIATRATKASEERSEGACGTLLDPRSRWWRSILRKQRSSFLESILLSLPCAKLPS